MGYSDQIFEAAGPPNHPTLCIKFADAAEQPLGCLAARRVGCDDLSENLVRVLGKGAVLAFNLLKMGKRDNPTLRSMLLSGSRAGAHQSVLENGESVLVALAGSKHKTVGNRKINFTAVKKGRFDQSREGARIRLSPEGGIGNNLLFRQNP